MLWLEQVVVPLVNAVKEQQKKINDLEERLRILEELIKK
jgi:hypothetical protein